MIDEWKDRAACKGMDSDIFFPVKGRPTEAAEVTAREACARCPVIRPCLDWALKHEVDGFWAGTSPRDRYKLRKQLDIVPHLLNSTDLRDNIFKTKKRGERWNSSESMTTKS